MTGRPGERVADYPRPPRLEPSQRRIRIRLSGGIIAETRAAWRVLETFHPPAWYLPPAAFASGVLPLHYAVRDRLAKSPAGKCGVEIRLRFRDLLSRQVIIHNLRPAGHFDLLILSAQERKESNPRRRIWSSPFYH